MRVSRSFLRLAVFLCVFNGFAGADVASAKTLYVDRWGSNSGSCGKSSPCETVQHAIGLSADNDRIVVGPGNFSENLSVFTTGLKLESVAGRHGTTIEAANAAQSVLRIFRAKVRIGKKGKGFTLTGATVDPAAGIEINVSGVGGMAHIRIEGNRIGRPRKDTSAANSDYANYYGILQTSSDGGGKIQIRNNIFQNNQAYGLYCTNCFKAIVQENRFESNGWYGITFLGNSQNLLLSRNVISSNSDLGVSFSDSSGSAAVRDNVAELNDKWGLVLEEGEGARIESNIVSSNGFSGIFVDQDSQLKSMIMRKNLAVDNANSGLIVQQTLDARMENNTAVDNGLDGIRLIDAVSTFPLRNNNTFTNGACGISSTSGTNTYTRHFFQGNAAATCGPGNLTQTGNPVNKPGSVFVNKARALIGG